MSTHEHESTTGEYDRPVKRRIQRRHGACEPCRSSKTKCDGRLPCGACRSERRRQCPCVYSEKAMKLQQVTAEIRRRAESEKRSCDDVFRSASESGGKPPADDIGDLAAQSSFNEDDTDAPPNRRTHQQLSSEITAENARMSQPVSVCAAIEEFKRLKHARGYSAQVVSRCNGFEVSEHPATMRNPDNTAQMCMSIASVTSSSSPRDLSREPHDVQILGDKFHAIDNLIKNGCLSRAWSELGSVVREAQVIQASINKNQALPPSPAWRRLWHDILDLEAQLGLTLGHPTCLVLSRAPRSRTRNDGISLEESLEETRLDLYQHIQGILGLNLFSPTAIRDFLERAQDILQYEPFNQIGLCTTEGHSAAVRDSHLNTHLLFMIIFCRMASLCDLFSKDLTNGSWSDTPAAEIIRASNLHQPRQKLAYCRKMFRSAKFILESFISLHQDDAQQTGRNWIRCHSAYIAAMILGIAKLRHEVEWHSTTEKLKQMENAFVKLSLDYPDNHLYSVAIIHLRDLNSVKEPASEATLNKHKGIKHRKRSVPGSMRESPIDTDHPMLADTSMSSSTSPVTTLEDSLITTSGSNTSGSTLQQGYLQNNQQIDNDYRPQLVANGSFQDSNLGHLSLFQDNSATYSNSASSFTDATNTTPTTSFSEPDLPLQAIANNSIVHPGPPFAYPFPYNVFHPPMVWNNPPFVLGDQRTNPLTLQIPGIPQYASDASPVTCESSQQYDLTNHPSSKTVSHGSSPAQVVSEGTTIPTRISPVMLSTSNFKSTRPGCMGVVTSTAGEETFIQHGKRPLPNGNVPHHPARPGFERTNSANAALQHGHPMLQNCQPVSQMDWQPHGAHSQTHNGSLNGLVPLRHENETDHRHPNLSSRHLNEPQFFAHTMGNQQNQIMAQVFPPVHMACLDSNTGMFDQSQLAGHYAQPHPSPYPKYYVQAPGPLQEQWRRMSVDASGAAGHPY